MSDDFEGLMNSPREEKVNPAGVVTTAIDYPTIFSDGCIFATMTGGVVRLTFVETILEPMDAPSPGQRVRHVGTMVMPTEGFAATLQYLNHRAKEFGVEVTDGE